ncbi:MAG: RNA polymerase sigma-70 factor [Algibacter sp.]
MNIDFSNNKTLIEHLRKGHEDAFAYLMDTHHKKLCVYAKSLCRDIYIAEDIVQNIFLSVWEKRQKLKDIYSIQSYLYQSVYNEFINQHRKKATLITLEKAYIKTLNTILEEEEDTSELSKLITLVKQEIQELPPKCKEIFIMGKQEGLTYAEIAEHLNISFRTVENQMSKAFAIIREKAGDKMNTVLFLLFGINKKFMFIQTSKYLKEKIKELSSNKQTIKKTKGIRNVISFLNKFNKTMVKKTFNKKKTMSRV